MSYLNPHTHQLDTTDYQQGWLVGNSEGVHAGRRQAAAAIRAKAANYSGEQYRHFEMAARIADGNPVPQTRQDATAPEHQPRIVVLCGSTRFRDEFHQANENLTMQGCIVLMPGVFSHATGRVITDEQKAMLDHLHLRKIDLADEVVVVSDASGYYGDSTRREIAYAEQAGKPVRYLVGVPA